MTTDKKWTDREVIAAADDHASALADKITSVSARLDSRRDELRDVIVKAWEIETLTIAQLKTIATEEDLNLGSTNPKSKAQWVDAVTDQLTNNRCAADMFFTNIANELGALRTERRDVLNLVENYDRLVDIRAQLPNVFAEKGVNEWTCATLARLIAKEHELSLAFQALRAWMIHLGDGMTCAEAVDHTVTWTINNTEPDIQGSAGHRFHQEMINAGALRFVKARKWMDWR